MNKRLKITFNSPAVLLFVFICFAATLCGVITDGKSTELIFMTYHSPLSEILTYLRFFTHVFGHNGWAHFIGNAMYLLLLGPILEEKHGAGVIWATIGVTALVTGVINYIFFPAVGLCGASGVVFAFILLASFTGYKNREIPITFILVAVLFLGQQVYDAINAHDTISNMAHIAGGVIGAIFGFILNRRGR